MSDPSASSSARSIRKVLIVNVLAVLVLLELVPLVFFRVTEGRWVYRALEGEHPVREVVRKAGIQTLSGNQDPEGRLYQLHPFFGFVLKPRVFNENPYGLRVNNHGFFAEVPYPIVKTDEDEFIIAILGGSVANDVSLHEVVHRGEPSTLVEHLKQVPGLEGKAFRIMNLASGGYKQPQQLLILTYFLSIGQEIDLLLNVDGFNEVALPPLNHRKSIAVSMPSAQHFLPLAALADGHLPAMRSMVRIAELKEELSGGIEAMERGGWAFRYAWNRLRVQNLLRDLQAEVARLEQDAAPEKDHAVSQERRLIALAGEDQVPTKEQAYRMMVDEWAEASILLHQLATARGIPYVHVLQPNQYHPTQRTHTAHEMSIFGNTPYSAGVERGYPLLIERSVELEARGIPFLNAVAVFDQEPGGVYRDSCCHYTLVGQELLSSQIGAFLAEHYVGGGP